MIQCAVLKSGEIVFSAGYDECVAWMRSHRGIWDDIRYLKDGKLWRCASYVL